MRLNDFAWMPYSDDRDDYRNHVVAAAINEEWGEDLRYVRDYIHDNFELSYAQSLVREDPDKRYAFWRVGHLTTREGEPVTIVVIKNRLSGRQPYSYRYTFDRARFDIKFDDIAEAVEALETTMLSRMNQ